MSKVMSLDDILNQKDVEYREVKAFGGVIRIRSLTAEEMLTHNQRVEDKVQNSGLLLMMDSLVDAEGNPIGDLKKLERLRKKNSKEIGKVISAIMDLNAMTAAAQKKLEEEAKKDSGGGASAVSPTASPSS